MTPDDPGTMRARLLRAFALVAAFFLAGSAGAHAVELIRSGHGAASAAWWVVAVSLLAVGTLIVAAVWRFRR